MKRMENQEKEAQEYADKVYDFAANLMFEQKKDNDETKRLLIEQGLAAEDADRVIAELRAQWRQTEIEAGNKNMLYGALWCVGGLAVTIWSYMAAEEGGRYVLAWGAVIFGAIQFFRGLSQRL